MPRCQRTFRRLPPGVALPGVGAVRWTCPYCADRETYATVRDSDLLRYADAALAECVRDFGTPSDARRPLLLLFGLKPECVREVDNRRYDIYLQSGSEAFQWRLQIGHEIFHRVCSQGRVFHWTHEMLACVFSVRLLYAQGLTDYARITHERFTCQAGALTSAQMQAASLVDEVSYPPGLYGRAYLTGQALTDAVGWPHLCRLARFGLENASPDNRYKVLVPDVAGWLRSLPTEEKHRAGQILGITLL